MMLLSRRSLLGIAAVVDIAIHCRTGPVPAKHLAERHHLPPRHLETLLQVLVREGILKGIRGPRGGYELARDRRHVTAGDVVRAAMLSDEEENDPSNPTSVLVETVVGPAVITASGAFLAALDATTIEQLSRDAEKVRVFESMSGETADFTI